MGLVSNTPTFPLIRIAISPCPNDTFGFYALLTGKIPTPFRLQPILYDIESLNRAAESEEFDLIKMSVSTFAQSTEKYALLKTGTAFGTWTGPLLIGKSRHIDVKNARIAIPGRNTTAYFLYKALFGDPRECVEAPYFDILKMVEKGTVDAGIIIHETRYGLHKSSIKIIHDLGKAFYRSYSLEVPLGVVGLNKKLSFQLQQELSQCVYKSFEYAKRNPKEAYRFAGRFAQEKNKKIIAKHIRAFVSPATYKLTQDNIESVQGFLKLNAELSQKAFSACQIACQAAFEVV